MFSLGGAVFFGGILTKFHVVSRNRRVLQIGVGRRNRKSPFPEVSRALNFVRVLGGILKRWKPAKSWQGQRKPYLRFPTPRVGRARFDHCIT